MLLERTCNKRNRAKSNFLFSNKIRFDSHQADLFNLFIFLINKRRPKIHSNAVIMDELTAWTNIKVLL